MFTLLFISLCDGVMFIADCSVRLDVCVYSRLTHIALKHFDLSCVYNLKINHFPSFMTIIICYDKLAVQGSLV